MVGQETSDPKEPPPSNGRTDNTHVLGYENPAIWWNTKTADFKPFTGHYRELPPTVGFPLAAGSPAAYVLTAVGSDIFNSHGPKMIRFNQNFSGLSNVPGYVAGFCPHLFFEVNHFPNGANKLSFVDIQEMVMRVSVSWI